MPFNIHRHTSSVGGQADIESNQHTTTNALFQASQTLGSVGVPTSHYSRNNTVVNAVGTAGPLFSSGDNTTAVNGANTMTSAHPPTGNSAPITPTNRPGTQFEPTHRALAYARQPEELHMSNSGGGGMEGHQYQSHPSHYNPGDSLSIHLQPSTPQYNNTAPGTNVPGALQPGPLNRPTTLASNTAPGSIPTLPQLSTQMQLSPQTNRSAAMSHSHGYSRSSPAGMDQPKYKPFSNTSEANKFTSPIASSYASQMQQASSYSPLGLADIRPRADTGYTDGTMSPTALPEVDAPQYPTNSNYLTPWPIYAVDWCKWSPKQNTSQAGKLAIGSYLEDNHNFVGSTPTRPMLKLTVYRFKYWMLKEHHPILTIPMGTEVLNSSRRLKLHIHIRLPESYGSHHHPINRQPTSWLHPVTISGSGLYHQTVRPMSPIPSIGPAIPETLPFKNSPPWLCYQTPNLPNTRPQSPLSIGTSSHPA